MARLADMTRTMPKQTLRRMVRAVLTHPVVLQLKTPLRNLWWTIAGAGTRNPPVPRTVTSILFVCLGNICRSPFGAELAKNLLTGRGRSGVRCSSAGIRPSQDNRSPDEACRASAAYGVTLTEHRPQALTHELMESHDMVIVMEWRHLSQLRAKYPGQRDRIFLLPLFDAGARHGYERYNIGDPFGRPLAAFEDCYRRMERALRRCLAAVEH